jgi:hypothetical protein
MHDQLGGVPVRRFKGYRQPLAALVAYVSLLALLVVLSRGGSRGIETMTVVPAGRSVMRLADDLEHYQTLGWKIVQYTRESGGKMQIYFERGYRVR